jgi:cyclic beta-1,2-glucan synthetase
MSIVAIANALLDGRMRERFHSDVAVQATELLLQERTPRDVSVAHPRAEEVGTAARVGRPAGATGAAHQEPARLRAADPSVYRMVAIQ